MNLNVSGWNSHHRCKYLQILGNTVRVLISENVYNISIKNSEYPASERLLFFKKTPKTKTTTIHKR